MKAALVLFSAVVTSAVSIVDKAKQSLLDYSNDLDHLGCQIIWPTMKIVFSIQLLYMYLQSNCERFLSKIIQHRKSLWCGCSWQEPIVTELVAHIGAAKALEWSMLRVILKIPERKTMYPKGWPVLR
jgi:hypothetical protein